MTFYILNHHETETSCDDTVKYLKTYGHQTQVLNFQSNYTGNYCMPSMHGIRSSMNNPSTLVVPPGSAFQAMHVLSNFALQHLIYEGNFNYFGICAGSYITTTSLHDMQFVKERGEKNKPHILHKPNIWGFNEERRGRLRLPCLTIGPLNLSDAPLPDHRDILFANQLATLNYKNRTLYMPYLDGNCTVIKGNHGQNVSIECIASFNHTISTVSENGSHSHEYVNPVCIGFQAPQTSIFTEQHKGAILFSGVHPEIRKTGLNRLVQEKVTHDLTEAEHKLLHSEENELLRTELDRDILGRLTKPR